MAVQPHNLSVITYNTGFLEVSFGGVCFYENPPFASERLFSICQALAVGNFDIILLQECYRKDHAELIYNSVRHNLPYMARSCNNGREFFLEMHNGLVIFSKYKIKSYEFRKFQNQNGGLENVFNAKGYLIAHVEFGDESDIIVANVHLSSGILDPEALDNIRKAQIDEIIEATKGEKSVIVGGDWNFGPSSDGPYAYLIKNNFHDQAFEVYKNIASTTDLTVETTLHDAIPKLARDYVKLPETLQAIVENDLINEYDSNQAKLLNEPSVYPQSISSVIANHAINQTAIHYKHLKREDLLSGMISTEHFIQLSEFAKVFMEAAWLQTKEAIRKLSTQVTPTLESDIFKLYKTHLEPTWDPENSLNSCGPHAHCEPVRCDHIFIRSSPSSHLSSLTATHSYILYRDSSVTVPQTNSCYIREAKTTRSDHYAVLVVLQYLD